jgi:F-type H+-transporting ATPase subunit delta
MPYAKALYDVIRDQSPEQVEKVIEQLDLVAETVEAVPDFLKVMVTPMVSVETKTTILDSVLDELKISDPTRKFIHVVQRQFRMQYMPKIRDTYRELVDREMGRVRAEINVAYELSKDDQKKIVDTVKAVVGSDVSASFKQNPELLAGFRVQVGSKVFDGSLVGQLAQLRRQTQLETTQG